MKPDPMKEIYGPGDDNYGRDEPIKSKPMKPETNPINDVLTDLEAIQKNNIELITHFRDNYQGEPELSMILKGFSDASGEIHKMQVRVAKGEQPAKSEKSEQEEK